MERFIRTAWRAFWVGLGASAVLIGNSLATPAPGSPVERAASAPPESVLVTRTSPSPATVDRDSVKPLARYRGQS